MFFLDQLLGISGCHVAQMAIEDFFDDFMELLDAVSVEGATRATLEVRRNQSTGGSWMGNKDGVVEKPLGKKT